MKDRLGFIVNHLGNTQMAHFLIHNVNEHLEKHYDTDIIVFFENVVRTHTTPHFAGMNVNEAWDFNGTVVATSLSTAEKLLTFPGKKRRLLYVYDLEWLRPPEREFGWYESIYRNPRIELIARSESHALIIENTWSRRPIGVVEDFNIKKLITYGQN